MYGYVSYFTFFYVHVYECVSVCVKLMSSYHLFFAVAGVVFVDDDVWAMFVAKD